MSTRKRRIRNSLDSSSDEDTVQLQDKTPVKTGQTCSVQTTRSSERIQKRRNRSFRMPSRDDVWNDILPTKSPEKYYHLKPKKLINNFTKENNSYNYDPVYTSGSESMDDFIDDEEEDDGLSYRYRQPDRQTKKTTHRIKHRRTRLIVESSDSDSCHVDALEDLSEASKCLPESDDKAVNEAEIHLSAFDEGFDEEGSVVEDNTCEKEIENKGNTNEKMKETDKDPNADNFGCKETGKDNFENRNEGQTTDFGNKGLACARSVTSVTPSCSYNAEEDSDDQTGIGANFVNVKKTKVIESDSSSEGENIKPGEHFDNSCKETNGEIAQTRSDDGGDDDDENIENTVSLSDSDAADSFIVDDDDSEEFFDSTDDNKEVSNDNSNSDSDKQPESKRKTRVREKKLQKKKERDELFEQYRAAHRRRKSKESSG